MEKRAWVRLIMSARGESAVVNDNYDETDVKFEEYTCRKRKDSFWDVTDEDEKNGVMSK